MDKLKLDKLKLLYNQKIKEFQIKLENSASLANTIQIFKEFYNYHHQIISKLGKNPVEHKFFYTLMYNNIIFFELKFLNYHSISPVAPNFQYLNNPKLLSYNDPEFKLYAIVMQGRNELASIQDIYTDSEFKKMNLTNYCFESATFVYRLCLALNIDAKIVKIEAGYNEDKQIYNGNGFHYFVWATLDEEH